MSISTEISRISQNVTDSLSAVAAKGVFVPVGSNSDDLPELIAQIQSGGAAITITDSPDSHGGTVREITAVDISNDTVTAEHLESGYTAHDAQGNLVTGTLVPGGGVDVPVFTGLWSSDWSTLTLTCDKAFAECYAFAENSNVGALANISLDDPLEPWEEHAALQITDYDSAEITYTSSGAYGPMYDIVYHSDGSMEYVSPSSMGTDLEVTQNGFYVPSPGVYTSVNVNVPSSAPTLQAKTHITPTESSQTVTADAGYDALSSVQIDPVSSSYVGSGVTRRASSDLTASGATVAVPAGYYGSQASKAVASGTEGTPTATKGTVSNHAVTVTPSVTNGAGYISGGTKTGTGVSVSASELVSGSETKTANGTYDVTNLAQLVVNVPSKAVYMYTGLASRTANSYGATNAKVTVTKAGTYNISYVAIRGSSSGTMGTNLHIGATEKGANTTWNNGTYGQYVSYTNQSIAANTDVTIYATSGNNSRTIYVGQLIVEEV